MGILILNGMAHSFAIMLPFIAMLGIAMVAAPWCTLRSAVMAAHSYLW